jgi:uncharacterized protein YbgA (DUF1722 family)/uncharacterized protein YbbK (DUF523 family)
MTAKIEKTLPLIGIGACLNGEQVRYNGVSKRNNLQSLRLEEHFQLHAFCPEVSIGLGIPRQPIRLVGNSEAPQAMDSESQTNNYTAALERFARTVMCQEPNLCGYILVKGSPSCGYERVKRYDEKGNMVARDGRGVFASALLKLDTLLPLEDEGRLNDPELRESFFCRAFVYHDWKTLVSGGLTVHGLITFYSRHKYLLMAHDYGSYNRAGRLLADAGNCELSTLADELIGLLMTALAVPAGRGRYSNVMLHILGYLKRSVSGRERQQLAGTIKQYRDGEVPLVVPIALLRHHFSNNPDPYISDQTFLQPYPDALQLRNQI